MNVSCFRNSLKLVEGGSCNNNKYFVRDTIVHEITFSKVMESMDGYDHMAPVYSQPIFDSKRPTYHFVLLLNIDEIYIYTVCTLCPGNLGVYIFPFKGITKGKQCFINYHSHESFALTKSDVKLYHGMKLKDWKPPTKKSNLQEH